MRIHKIGCTSPFSWTLYSMLAEYQSSIISFAFSSPSLHIRYLNSVKLISGCRRLQLEARDHNSW
uniref:Putative ovule protein n=1 Tax=Solanum chacoense TaxID=4108 RepID=A0A0V0H5K9_SOLCH